MVTIKKKAYARKGHAANKPEQELKTIAHSVSEFTAAHRKNVTILAAILVAALLIFSGISLKNSADEAKAATLFATAYEQYRNSGPTPDYAKALDLFRDVQKKYSSTPSGSLAAYYAANCLMNLGRNDEAIREYRSFVNRHKKDAFLLGLAYTRMGYLYKGLGNQADAVKAFEQADSLAGPGVATFELAKLYEAAGNTVESQKKYKIIAEKLGGTAWAMEAMGKVQKISPLPAAVPAKDNTEKKSK